jgi:hypothetical protein
VIPIFPGETTLNAASAFAADGDLELWLVIVLGALGQAWSAVGDDEPRRGKTAAIRIPCGADQSLVEVAALELLEAP